jgi:sugar phosphate permease
MLADGFPEAERAKKFTWFYLAIPLGSAIGYGLGGLVAGAWGWRASFLVAGLPGLALALWMAFQPDPERGAMDASPDLEADQPYLTRVKHVFTNRVWLACTLSYVAYTFAMGGLSTWGPTLLQRRFAVSTGQAGLVFGVLAATTGIIGTLLGGWLTDRWQGRWPDAGLWLSGLTLLGSAPVVAWALRAQSLPLVYALFFLGMLLLFVNTSPVNALTVSCLPASVRATGVGVNVFLIHLMGDAISPTLVGWKADLLHAAGIVRGEALGQAMQLVVPAILLSGVALWWARHRSAQA